MKESHPRHFETRFAVVGAGLAGFAASLAAIERGIETAQVGDTGAIAYTTGYLDLLGAPDGAFEYEVETALARLRQWEPRHPLARLASDDIFEAMAVFSASLEKRGIGYTPPASHSLPALLPVGGVKPSCSLPRTMLPGAIAFRDKTPAVIVDVLGLQGFSAREFVANLREEWPQLRFARLAFPDMESGAQVYPEVMARALEVPATLAEVAGRLRALKSDAQVIGLPAMLGIHRPDRVHARLQALVGVPVFEIPTIPPAVPGIRLREMFEQELPKEGLVLVPHQKVTKLNFAPDRVHLEIPDHFGPVTLSAEAVLLASGRFLSGGLLAERSGVREPLIGIPVTQPACREDWYRADYFAADGQPVNRAGIEVDAQFRPLGRDGRPVDERLFAAGSILAHHDWIRQRCGAGVAIATAYRSVSAVERFLTSKRL